MLRPRIYLFGLGLSGFCGSLTINLSHHLEKEEGTDSRFYNCRLNPTFVWRNARLLLTFSILWTRIFPLFGLPSFSPATSEWWFDHCSTPLFHIKITWYYLKQLKKLSSICQICEEILHLHFCFLEEWIHPLCECFLLYVQSLFLESPDSTPLKILEVTLKKSNRCDPMLQDLKHFKTYK